MNGHLGKPLNMEGILSMLMKILGGNKASRNEGIA
jgi:hypothetical protein